MSIIYINGFYEVSHDHQSTWSKRNEWLRETLGEFSEGDTWTLLRGEFAYNVEYENKDRYPPGTKNGDILVPLRWRFVNKDDALVFALRFNHQYMSNKGYRE